MSPVQKFYMAMLPPASAEQMKAESQSWMMRCSCGYERSVWQFGGVRWKATGTPRQLLMCSKCGQLKWQVLYRKATNP